MPELPEVELFKRHFDATCRGHRITGVALRDRRLISGLSPARLKAALLGARVRRSRRRGKHLLIDLGKPGWLTLHFGMNGSLWHVGAKERDPPYDRLRLDFSGGDHLAYINPRRIGRIGLAANPKSFAREEGLGPDALDRGLGAREFARLLSGARRDLKSALMDQVLIAGIGNLYSDEILFQARLNPRTRSDALPPGGSARLYRAMRRVLKTAVARRAGSETFLDRLPRGYLLPQRRTGGRCPRCHVRLALTKFSGRTAYFCPRCQPRQSGKGR